MFKYPFEPSTNAFAKLTILLLALAIFGSVSIATGFYHSPIFTDEGEQIVQPIAFSHKHHVKGLGLDCRYCHTSVETSSFAGIPDGATCKNCHSQIWKQSPMLQIVRDSLQKPPEWNRVIRLPDYVYFNHQIHIAKQIGCATCHGNVGDMNVVVQTRSFLMRDCLSCHKDPAKYVRPLAQLTNEAWDPLAHSTRGTAHALPSTDCSACHR